MLCYFFPGFIPVFTIKKNITNHRKISEWNEQKKDWFMLESMVVNYKYNACLKGTIVKHVSCKKFTHIGKQGSLFFKIYEEIETGRRHP